MSERILSEQEQKDLGEAQRLAQATGPVMNAPVPFYIQQRAEAAVFIALKDLPPQIRQRVLRNVNEALNDIKAKVTPV